MVRFLPLAAVLLAWAPDAFALFPPCPKDSLRLVPLDNGMNASGDTPWFIAEYTELRTTSGPDAPKTGKCEDRRPVAEGNTSSGSLQMNPQYAPKADFGIIALPTLTKMAIGDLSLQYSLDFDIDSAALANNGDWFDIVQLEFARSSGTLQAPQGSRSALYRLRKVQHDKGHTIVQVIESRSLPDDVAIKPPLIDSVVAAIPLTTDAPMITMQLRWTQKAREPVSLDPNSGNSRMHRIDAALEVIGPNGKVIYTAALPGQWADTLSIGLLDYNAPNLSAHSAAPNVYLDEVWLSAAAVK